MEKIKKQTTEVVGTFKSEWELYKKMVIPKEASAMQIEIMKEAFYAGAFVAQSMSLIIAGIYESDEFCCEEFIHSL